MNIQPRVISRKSEVTIFTDQVIATYESKGLQAMLSSMKENLLFHKIKFPLLEYTGTRFLEVLKPNDIIPFCDHICLSKAVGGYVIVGKILQLRLAENLIDSVHHATRFIAQADIWFICDIIGERVYGHALANQPDVMIPIVKSIFQKEENRWVIRGLGAGFHRAIHNGLSDKHAIDLFRLLLSKSDSKDKEIKQGTGWAAKTIVKYYPKIIDHFEDELENEKVGRWFKTKIRIGLERNAWMNRKILS